MSTFYTKVFGWSIQSFDPEYYLVTTTETDQGGMPKEPGAINGGMFRRTATIPHPVIVIEVPSVDKYLDKVVDAGGKVVQEKVKVHTMGFYARAADTEGNIIGVWENISQK